MPLVNCEINLILTWSAYWVISSAAGAIKFTITGTKLSFAIQNGFKRTITWNEYQSKVSIERQNLYLDHLIDPRLTILS